MTIILETAADGEFDRIEVSDTESPNDVLCDYLRRVELSAGDIIRMVAD